MIKKTWKQINLVTKKKSALEVDYLQPCWLILSLVPERDLTRFGC